MKRFIISLLRTETLEIEADSLAEARPMIPKGFSIEGVEDTTDGTRELDGICEVCREPIWIGQDKVHDEDGVEFHAGCVQ